MEKKRKDCYIQARITESERKNLEKIAGEFEISISDVIRFAILKFLGRRRKKKIENFTKEIK
ncbi:MAG: hypothetical protein ACFFDO_09785 [Candidatus Thorarchaeota archaeon]